MRHKPTIVALNGRIIRCGRCPRLRTHCREVSAAKTARYMDLDYWGRPVPNLLPPVPADARRAGLLIVGLAPGAHGANRTGRMFTGDKSGDFLFAAMHRAGLCNQPKSAGEGDGLALIGTVVTSAAHCAPPGNRPTGVELEACSGFLEATFDALPGLKAVLSLGQIAHRSVLGLYRKRGWVDRLNRYPFGHGAEFGIDGGPALVCSYHPSQQNTFTGRLTHDMLLAVLVRARELAAGGSIRPGGNKPASTRPATSP
jgi:uracil-DNA glycosylase